MEINKLTNVPNKTKYNKEILGDCGRDVFSYLCCGCAFSSLYGDQRLDYPFVLNTFVIIVSESLEFSLDTNQISFLIGF